MMKIADLVVRVSTEPSLLFIGQNLNGQRFVESFFRQAEKKQIEQVLSGERNISYNGLFQQFSDLIDKAQNQEILKKIVLETLLNADQNLESLVEIDDLLRLGWSGVFTSAMDRNLNNIGLKNVLCKADRKIDYFSKKNLHLTYLYGQIGDESRALPLNFDDLMSAQAQKDEFLRRLLNQIKGYGLLVIDGWDIASDWISENDLNAFADYQKNSLFIFGATKEMLKNRSLQNLVNKGIAFITEERFYQCLEKEGLVGNEDSIIVDLVEDEDGIPITIEVVESGKVRQQLKYLSYQTCNQLESSIIVLNDSMLSDPDYISKEEFFLRFMQTGNSAPMWGGYASGFYFKRDVDDELLAAVEKQLKNSDPFKQSVIIIEGQNCSGKTATLGNLAIKIKQKKQYPVLFITSEMQEQDNYDVLERLIKNHLNERLGARKTVIIWDKNTYERDATYEKMRKSLEECNVVIVGSRYSTGEIEKAETKRGPIVVKLSEDLSAKTEVTALRDTLKSISLLYASSLDVILDKVKSLSSKIGSANSSNCSFSDSGNWFLLILHKLFEELHEHQRAAVGAESSLAQQQLVSLLESYSIEGFKTNAFGKLLKMLDNPMYFDSIESKNKAKIVFNMIAVSGKYGISLPALILSRTYENESNDCSRFIRNLSYSSMLKVDLLDNGMLAVHFRHALEASLFLEMQFQTFEELKEKEIESLLTIIENTNFDDADGEGSESWIILQLIRKYGPNGPDKKRYKKYYNQISHAIRNANVVGNAEAILISCHLIREAFDRDTLDQVKNEALQQTRGELRKVINQFGNMDRSKQMARLKVELAANILLSLPSQGNLNATDRTNFEELTILLADAMNIDFSQHSADVFFNATLKIYSIETDKTRQAKLLSQMLQLVDDILDAPPGFLEESKIHEKILSVRILNNNYEEIENEYKLLLEKNSDIGIYRRAMRALGEYTLIDAPKQSDIIKVEMALKILYEHQKIVEMNPRSLYLMIRLMWINKTGLPPFTEKQFPPLNSNDWYDFYRLCSIYTNSQTAKRVALPYLLQAVYEFQFGSEQQFKQLMEVTRLIRYPARHITYLILCDSNKSPITMDVKLRKSHNKRAAFIAAIQDGKHFGTQVYFKESNFKGLIDIYEGKLIKNAVIGFSLYSAVAYDKDELMEQIGGMR